LRIEGVRKRCGEWATTDVHDVILESAVMLAIEPLATDFLESQPDFQGGLQASSIVRSDSFRSRLSLVVRVGGVQGLGEGAS
jgi:hypothetical protein